jgi:2-phosphoglycolate phosphatase
MRFDTVLFDLDGTLFDTAPDICAACNHTLQAFGYKPASESLLSGGVPFGMRAMLRLALPERDWPKADRGGPMYREFDRYYTEHSHALTRPFDGIPELVEELSRRGVSTGVVTNKYMRMVETLFGAFPFTRRFKAIVGGDSTKKSKPDPEPLLLAMSMCGASKGSTLYVGDQQSDSIAARNAGIASCAVKWGYGNFTPEPVEAWGAQHVAPSPSDILAIAEGRDPDDSALQR